MFVNKQLNIVNKQLNIVNKYLQNIVNNQLKSQKQAAEIL